MARAGTLPSYLNQRDVQPGEPVSFERSGEDETEEEDGVLDYDSPSSGEDSVEEESFLNNNDESDGDVSKIPSLDGEASFLL